MTVLFRTEGLCTRGICCLHLFLIGVWGSGAGGETVKERGEPWYQALDAVDLPPPRENCRSCLGTTEHSVTGDRGKGRQKHPGIGPLHYLCICGAIIAARQVGGHAFH